jgi:hypothetical protein
VTEDMDIENILAKEVESWNGFSTITNGILIPKPVVYWCIQKLSNLKVVNIGPGIHWNPFIARR